MRQVPHGGAAACSKGTSMQTYFTGRLLSADSLTAEQNHVRHQPTLQQRPPESSMAQAAVARSLSEAVAMSLPKGLLDEVALNPQPLPPRDPFDEAMSSRPTVADALGAFELQQVMSALTQAEALASTVTKKMDDAQNSVISKIG
jgi:hypothetical protein